LPPQLPGLPVQLADQLQELRFAGRKPALFCRQLLRMGLLELGDLGVPLRQLGVQSGNFRRELPHFAHRFPSGLTEKR
jgi:hypothetical protein